MPLNYMLDDGITEQGMAHRSYDKYGKRMFVATPKRDMSKKDATHGARSGVPAGANDSNTPRSDVGIK